MSISAKLDALHSAAKQNRWLRYFSIFCRLGLAAGFLPPGFVKIMGERFTSLSSNHPLGHYLEALHHTGYYFSFIGIVQVTAAILLLIPRTVTLGALLYFPVILNICILSLAVRFDGSFVSAPLMVLADLFLLCWNYEKLKYILPFNRAPIQGEVSGKQKISNKFPFLFFAGVAATVVIIMLIFIYGYKVLPRNTLQDCRAQFAGTNRTRAGYEFCDCIHQNGEPLYSCLNNYEKAADDSLGLKR